MKTNLFKSIELMMLDLFIDLLSNPALVRLLRRRLDFSAIRGQVYFYSILFSVFCIMGFISGYIYVALYLFGTR